MNILAIDPGYDKVGYAIFEIPSHPELDSGSSMRDFTFITSDLIKTNSKANHELRLKQVYDMLDQTIKLHKIDTIVIEQLFVFKNAKTVIKVAQSLGVIELVGAHNNLIVHRLTPLQIKQAVTGNGTADKLSVQKMIRLELGDKITFKDDDESDAVACGLAYIYNVR
ncbi:MAG: crossover junction endodeoxyribonuclease RuvC [bacterium]|nr:crossover junction endodeoxyribonuclease RuvC [bacterium]